MARSTSSTLGLGSVYHSAPVACTDCTAQVPLLPWLGLALAAVGAVRHNRDAAARTRTIETGSVAGEALVDSDRPRAMDGALAHQARRCSMGERGPDLRRTGRV
jgi:uncharacterized membrane protein